MTTKDLVRQSKSLVPSVHQRVVIGRGRGLRQFPWPVAPATRVQHGRRHHQSHDAATGRRRRRSRSAPHAAIFPGRPLIVAHGGSESRARTRLQRKQLTRRHCHAKTLRSRNQLTVCSLLKEAAEFLRVSISWLAKARMRGDGPPYAQYNRAIRYPESGLIGYIKSRLRLSTSQR